MKQLKVKNPKLQRVLDYFTGWKEWLLVAIAWIVAGLFFWLLTRGHVL